MNYKSKNFNWDDVPFEKLGSETRRKRLLKEADYKCTQCFFSKTRENGATILEIDHIDGNHKNNSKENLRLLCPNCHALTHNYRNWNRKKNTKTSSRIRNGNTAYKEISEKYESLKDRNKQENFRLELCIKEFYDDMLIKDKTYFEKRSNRASFVKVVKEKFRFHFSTAHIRRARDRYELSLLNASSTSELHTFL